MKLEVYTLRLPEDLKRELEVIARGNKEAMAELARRYIREGLERDHADKAVNYIAKIVREQTEAVMKPHVERLAKLTSKTGHISAAAAFLNVQAFMDLVPDEKRKIPVEMFEKAKKKAAAYMKMPVSEFNEKEEF